MKTQFALAGLLLLASQIAGPFGGQNSPGQFRVPARINLTAQQIQAMIEDCYTHQGGVVLLPAGTHDLGTTPLHLYSVCTLAGQHLSNTDIRYHGKGPAILLDEHQNTHSGHQGGTFRDIRLFSDDQGIGFAENQKDVEAADITIRDAEFYTKNTAIALGKEGKLLTYRIRLEHVITNASPDVPGIDLRNAISYDLSAVTIHPDGKEPTKESFAMLAGITGTMGRSSIVEGPWKSGGVYVKRELSMDGVHFECSGGALTIDGGEVIVGQYTFFAGPRTPVRLLHGGKLFVNGTLGFQQDGGGLPKRTPQQNPSQFKTAIDAIRAKSYICDETSSVYEHGQLMVGAEEGVERLPR